MPNHIHGIAWLGTTDIGDESVSVGARMFVGAQHAAPLQNAPISKQRRDVPGAVGMIVRSFKSAVTKRINESRGTRGVTVWQRNFYEHIIRDETALMTIRQYIADNPRNWPTDELYAGVNL